MNMTLINIKEIKAYSYAVCYSIISIPLALFAETTNSSERIYYNEKGEITNYVCGALSVSWQYDEIGNRICSMKPSITNYYSSNSLNQYTSISNNLGYSANLQYDADGNLTQDHRFKYVWDAENRLTEIRPAIFLNEGIMIKNSYDPFNRRVIKEVLKLVDLDSSQPPSPTNGRLENVYTSIFIYDQTRILLELCTYPDNTTNTNLYHWGADLSGTLDGAGGVGGLLAVTHNQRTFIPLADADGNITAYVSDQGEIVARFHYDPFGETIHESGELKDLFRFRFSTKYLDDETLFYDYGRRFYDPWLGRWLNRDPVGEVDGANLYAMLKNCPISKIEFMGLFEIYTHSRGWGHVGVTDDKKLDYDYGRYHGTYSGKGGLRKGPNVLKTGGAPFKHATYHFNVCPELDKKIRTTLSEKFNSGASVWPQEVLAKFKTKPKPLGTNERYTGSDWTTTDNCMTFTFSAVAGAVRKVMNDPSATQFEKNQAKVLVTLAWNAIWINTPSGVTAMLDRYAAQHNWITKGGQNGNKDDNSCCRSSK